MVLLYKKKPHIFSVVGVLLFSDFFRGFFGVRDQNVWQKTIRAIKLIDLCAISFCMLTSIC